MRIVVPFAPGGGADLIARLLQPHMQSLTGQSFYVENRAGAAGRIGTGVVAKSEPDGQTLLMTTESSIVIAPHMGVAMNYDPLKDFEPVSLLTRNSDHPGRASVGACQYAAGIHGACAREAGADVLRIVRCRRAKPSRRRNLQADDRAQHRARSFPGTGAAIPAVISNQVGAMWGFMAGLIPHIRNGSLKALAVGSKERSAALPDVPTVAESGVPGYEAASWIGLLAPADDAAALVDKLRGAAHDAMRRDRDRKAGARRLRDRRQHAEEFRQVIEADYAKYGKLGDLLKAAQVVMGEHPADAWRWPRSPPRSIRPSCRTDVRRKLGWLFLDYLRVCSVGARLPWSEWARSYVAIVGKAGSSHALFSPDLLNPQHATFLNVAYGSSFDADDTHVGAMLHPGVAVWSAALAIAEHTGASGPEVIAAVVAGYETIIRIGLAIQPSHFKRGFQSTGTCVAFGTAAAAGRLLFRGERPSGGSRRRSGLPAATRAASRSSITPARRASASRPRTRRNAASRRRCSPSRVWRPNRHHRRDGRLCPRLCGRLESGSDRERAGRALPSDGCADEVPCGGGARRRRHRRHAGAAARAGFSVDDIAAMQLGIPRIIQGRLTNPHPVDLQAAQMCLPFSVALAAKLPLAAGSSARC